ncbi:hypothetical protein CON05_18780 [Bacillus cereus]|nr:hypothetical protein CON05_18780 [Bacillus cereus]
MKCTKTDTFPAKRQSLPYENKKNAYKTKESRHIFYPALMGSKTPTSKFSESKEVRWGINCP